MAKLTETTKPVERTFLLELSEPEISIIRAVLVRSQFEGPRRTNIVSAIDAVISEFDTKWTVTTQPDSWCPIRVSPYEDFLVEDDDEDDEDW